MLPPDPDLAILLERRLAPLMPFGPAMLLARLAPRLARSAMRTLVASPIPRPRLVRRPGGGWPLAILAPRAIRRPLCARPIASAGT